MARYTADEMREAANAVYDVSINDNCEYFYQKDDKFNPFLVRDMLRQAADEMERKEKREKRYEYAEKTWDGIVDSIHKESFHEVADSMFYGDSTIVRREVGEWEEIKE